MTRRISTSPAGWPIVGYATVLLFLLFSAELGWLGIGEPGIRQVVRTSAQTSLLLFSTAFAASSLYQVHRSSLTRWLLANRRYIGVSFGLSHFAHLAALIALAVISQPFVDNLNAVTIVGGGLGYAFLTAMVATSFDRTAAALGTRWWGLLHKVGAYYLWFLFFQSYLPRMFTSVAYTPAVALLVAVLGLRLAVGWRSRQPRRATAARS